MKEIENEEAELESLKKKKAEAVAKLTGSPAKPTDQKVTPPQ
jgi:hypothetical protein